MWFKVDARAGAVWLTSLRKSTGGAILLVGINKNGVLIARNNVTKITYQSTVGVINGVWHRVDVHLKVGAGARFDVDLDSVPVTALSRSNGLGTSPITRIKIGDTSTGRTFDVTFDDVSAASDPGSDDATDPTQPTGLEVSLQDALSVHLTWQPSDDDTGVTSYTMRRSTDGTNFSLAGSSITTSFVDPGLAPATTYWWTVEAVDAAGNRSAPSAPATATTGSVDPGRLVGRWSEPLDVGVVGVHAAVLFTGRCCSSTRRAARSAPWRSCGTPPPVRWKTSACRSVSNTTCSARSLAAPERRRACDRGNHLGRHDPERH